MTVNITPEIARVNTFARYYLDLALTRRSQQMKICMNYNREREKIKSGKVKKRRGINDASNL